MKSYGPDLFKGTAFYYSRYRPVYPGSLIRYLINRFSLDGQGVMLDLGCGNGRLSLRFTDWFQEITGVDTEPEMIDEAVRLCREQRLENLNWFLGDLQSFRNQYHNSPFKLVTIAQAFHWMKREETLSILYDMIHTGGGAAIIDYSTPDLEPPAWKRKVNEVVKRWYGIKRKAGEAVYTHPSISHEQIVRESRFTLETQTLPQHEKKWSVDDIIGNLYSTSYGSKRFLGEKTPYFEKDLKEELLSLNDEGIFWESMQVSIKLAIKI
ncbi:class I SAM-dependent methyltransferase [Peribacillus deserti]|uniref:Class I SAM-dependent methyltransferase n=1 Tax=Peribacillus deserti TaxID=673318 RepID=A0A2N5M3A9_9BACI|nr:class I SAM-dependent methyltransferase [Peribacillus deserti]PLT28854.1 class I SAM-dependent methyltransferase [Peribacillus deserti]